MNSLIGNRWATLGVIALGFLMIVIDTTIVNVSIPTIIKDLGASLTSIEWVISGYALSYAALLITFGRLGDLFGPKRLFIGGLIVFTFFSFIAGHANTPTQLVVARILQGIGSAMLAPATLSIISSNFTGPSRTIAFGVWGTIAGVATALGPILGGYITTYSNWRWIFYVNIPLGIITIILSLLIIREAHVAKKQRLDLRGMITSALGFTFLVFGLIEGQTYGWWRPVGPYSIGGLSPIPFSFALSVIFLGAFILLERWKTLRNDNPAVNTALFKSRAFRYGLVAAAMISLGQFSSLFTVPIFFQVIRGYTPLQSGLATLPIALATIIAAPLSASVVDRIGSKIVISSGLFLSAAALFLLSNLTADTTYQQLLLPFILLGVGVGFAISQTTQVSLHHIQPEDTGSASGVLNTVRQIGSALGIAIIGAVLAHQISSGIGPRLNTVTNLPREAKAQIVRTVTSQGAAYGETGTTISLPQPPPEVRADPILLSSYQENILTIYSETKTAIYSVLALSIGQAVRVGAWFVLLGAVLSLLIPDIRHPKPAPVAE